MNYGIKAALSIIAASVEIPSIGYGDIQSQVLHRWIGERYMHEIGSNTGSGNPMQYTDKDIRRAIAYRRTIALIGAGLGRDASLMRERVREVASWHTRGWVIVGDGDVGWTDDTDYIWSVIDSSATFMLIPCSVPLLP